MVKNTKVIIWWLQKEKSTRETSRFETIMAFLWNESLIPVDILLVPLHTPYVFKQLQQNMYRLVSTNPVSSLSCNLWCSLPKTKLMNALLIDP